jgi:hypothetical protein
MISPSRQSTPTGTDYRIYYTLTMYGCKWNLHNETCQNAAFSAVSENELAFGHVQKIFVENG